MSLRAPDTKLVESLVTRIASMLGDNHLFEFHVIIKVITYLKPLISYLNCGNQHSLSRLTYTGALAIDNGPLECISYR